jgi:hypothetical protein
MLLEHTLPYIHVGSRPSTVLLIPTTDYEVEIWVVRGYDVRSKRHENRPRLSKFATGEMPTRTDRMVIRCVELVSLKIIQDDYYNDNERSWNVTVVNYFEWSLIDIEEIRRERNIMEHLQKDRLSKRKVNGDKGLNSSSWWWLRCSVYSIQISSPQ